ncbi:MAG: class II aldolase/adducin family protein [Hyphomonadaceae bacterium]|nr:class II aldolase/adducin family protein [Hyphomonadaceae bacterium]
MNAPTPAVAAAAALPDNAAQAFSSAVATTDDIYGAHGGDPEWRARVDCAALYRLIALYGWDDMIFTHISLRIPGPDHHFLINPYGFMFDEITASSLVKVDLEGHVVAPTPYFINPAGFTIHSAIHAAREDAICVIHCHTDAGVAVSAQKGGLLPISQTAMACTADLAYHDYEGVALDLDERERLVADIGHHNFMMLRNHGTLTVGDSAPSAFMRMFYLERACKMQVLAQAGGDLLQCDGDMEARVGKQVSPAFVQAFGGMLAWPGLLRKVMRQSPGFNI